MRFLTTISVLLLTGCSAMQISQPPVEVTHNQLSSRDYDASRTIEPITVRSKLGGEVTGSEFEGAECVLKNEMYSANVVTPGIVNFPVHGMHSDPVTVTCRHEGQVSTKVSQLYSKQDDATRRSAVHGGLIGMLVGEAFISGRDKSEHDYGYTDVIVLFEEN